MSTQAQSLETAQALLKKAAPSQGGRTLHEHLTDVLLTIAKEQPNDPLGSFEFISARVKQSHQWQQQQQSGGEVPVLLAQTNSRKFLAGIDEAAKLKLLSACAAVNKLVSPVPPGDGEEAPEAAVGFPNVIEQCQMLQWAGVSLSSEEAYLLGASLENLARNKKLSNVRLFGKIFGSQRDYIIAEAKFTEPPEAEPAPENDATPPAEKPEDAGAGCNEYVYFVAHSHSGEWTLLPNVTPKQIKIARKLRRGFVGDLTAAVPGYPRFPCPESAYLRAQIARIVASTVVEPKGLHTVNSEEEDSPPTLQEDEEFKGLPLSELSAGLDNWVHARPFVFKQGRAQKVNPPEPEEEQEESEEEKKVVKPNIVKTAEELAEETAENEEEAVDLLRALSEDADDKGQPTWALRAWPLQGRGGAPNVSHGFVSLRSLLWPGAVAVAETDSKRNAVFYCGYGLKRLPVGKRYSPAPIPAVQPEYGHPLPQPAEDEEEKPVDPFAEQTDPLPPPPKPVEEEAQPVGDGEEQEAQENEEEDS